MVAFTRWIIRNSVRVVLAAALLSGVAGFYTALLYTHLRTDLEELLPASARSVQDLNEIRQRLPASSSLAVLVFSRHPRASKRFVNALAHELEQNEGPGRLVSRVEYKIDREIDFFEKRKSLFITVPDLERIRDYVKDKKEYEIELRNPLNIFSGVELREPKLDFNGLVANYSKPLLSYLKFPGGYYASSDETIRALLVYMHGDASDVDRAKLLRQRVDALIRKLDPARFDPDLRIHYTGDVENVVEEQKSLVSDLELSAAVVMVLVSLAMLLFFRDLSGTAALVISLLAGTSWTFGLSYFLVGYLNANSAFLGSIVLGNGINFGIILLARYLELRRDGVHSHFAVVEATRSTRTATLLAALAAGLSYGALMITPFRGFRQFGLIGLIGMVFCWISAYTIQPALLTIFERFRNKDPKPQRHTVATWVALAVQRYYKAIAAVSVLLAILAGYSVHSYRGKLVETDTEKLRDRRSMEQGSGYYAKYLDAIFGRYLSPLIVLPRTQRQSDLISAKLKAMVNSPEGMIGRKKMIAAVYSEQDFIPKNQPRKIALLREIRKLIPPRLERELSPADRKRMERFLQPQSFHAFSEKDLPKEILDRFRETDGSFGKTILVEPVLDHSIINDGDNQTILLNRVRAVVDSVAPGTPIAGQLPLTVDMYQAVRTHGPRATEIAFIAVVMLVILLFRDLRTVALALTALLLGVLWFFGILLGLDLKVNFLNFIAFPITFGIGVDYGVNIFQRYRIEGKGSIARVIARTGGAVALASLTTMIGYGSLMLATNQAFVSFGRLALLGELTCVTAAILSLPSFLMIVDRKGRAAQRAEEMRRAG